MFLAISLNTQNTTGDVQSIGQINKNLHQFMIIVNGHILTGHNLLHLSLTPGQIFWGLGVHIGIKLRKIIVCPRLPAFSLRAG